MQAGAACPEHLLAGQRPAIAGWKPACKAPGALWNRLGGMPHKGVIGARSSTRFAGSPRSALAPALREVGAIRLFHRGSVPACPVHVRKMLPSVKPPHEDERDPAPFFPSGFGPRPVLVRAGLSDADAPSLFFEDVNPPATASRMIGVVILLFGRFTKLERDAAARARNKRETNASGLPSQSAAKQCYSKT